MMKQKRVLSLSVILLLGACAPSPSIERQPRSDSQADTPPRLTFVSGSWDTPPAVLSWTSAYHPSITRPVEVSVGAIIRVDGRPDSLHILFPDVPGLSYDVIDAANQWAFSPAMSDGEPVEARVAFEVMLRHGERKAPNSYEAPGRQ